MKYLHAVKGSAVAFILFIIAVIFIPGKGASKEVELILTVSTFLFAILAGFFISRFNSRHSKIKEYVAAEDAFLLSFYRTSLIYGKKFSDKIKELIDKYYIVSYDFDILFNYKHTEKYLVGIYKELVKNKKYRAQGTYEAMLDQLAAIEENRNKSAASSEDKISIGQWMILITLSGIIIFSLFYIKTSSLHSPIVTILFSTTIILVLLTLRDLQKLRLNGNMLVFESGEQVLESIGKLRYYNQRDLKKGSVKVPKHIKKYRLGLHKPGEKFNIKIINVK
jgi:hypothetical protein